MARGLESGADSYLLEPVEPEVLIATINAMLRAKRAEEAAREMALEWQATFDAIEDGVAVVDAEGHIQRSTSSLASLLGFTTAELRGQVCYKLWPDPEAGEAPFFLAQQSRRRESSEFIF